MQRPTEFPALSTASWNARLLCAASELVALYPNVAVQVV
jgi:hypothetical protein